MMESYDSIMYNFSFQGQALSNEELSVFWQTLHLPSSGKLSVVRKIVRSPGVRDEWSD
jgi:hypothetical protein